MNKTIALLCTAMYAGVTMCAQKDFEKGLVGAEVSCHVFSYKGFLKKANFSQERINDSLFTVINRCSGSGNLAELIQHNLAQGGQTTATKPLYGSQETPLMHLTMQIKKESQDLAAAIQVLVNNGDPLLHKSLASAVMFTKIAAVKMLLSAGADPLQPVGFWKQIGPHTTAINESAQRLEETNLNKEYHNIKLTDYCEKAANCQNKQVYEMHEGYSVAWWHRECDEHKRDSAIFDQRIREAEAVSELLKARVATAQTQN